MRSSAMAISFALLPSTRGESATLLAAAADVEFLIAAVASDRLYFPVQSDELAAALPGDVAVHTIESEIGHDGFLTETDRVGVLLRGTFFSDSSIDPP